MGRFAKESQWRRNEMMILYSSFLFLLSLSIVLMPIASEMKSDTMILLYCAGVCFWVGIVGTFYMSWRINQCRKRSVRINDCKAKWKQIGLLHFFKNKYATLADSIMFFSLVGLVCIKLFTKTSFFAYLFLAVFIISFGMHCMLNGKCYEYIKEKRRDVES